MSLHPCAGCARHVRATERECPFCGGVLEAIAERTPVVVPRAGRAAMMLLGVVTSIDASGCIVGVPEYGAPPLDVGASPDAGDDR